MNMNDNSPFNISDGIPILNVNLDNPAYKCIVGQSNLQKNTNNISEDNGISKINYLGSHMMDSIELQNT